MLRHFDGIVDLDADWTPTVAKAQRYLNAVSQLSWTDDTLSGKVQGTERRPYRVNVQFLKKAAITCAKAQ